ERADMAAHLHDSVLQTLALIQKRADDPRTVATLARKQERELRTYLYGDVLREQTLKAALTAAAAEVDDERGIPVEVVCVGDCDLTDDLGAMIRAAREAILNAAKHSGASRIDVYAEVDEDVVEIFIRDRGRGFDIGDIGDDRMGVKGSIIGRMERHGGTARIRSSAEDGTEVRLEMKR
ncbi:MAG: histidine kinase, partial [Propionibacteriaceae bacterium]|nr:histidine kinase [Propionibacteriaceae bacterium]